MRKCKHCLSEIEDNATVCPNCRKSQRTPTWVIVLIVVFVCIIFIPIMVGVLASDETSTTSSDETTKSEEGTKTTVKQEKFTLEDGHTGSADEYNVGYYIEGYIQNNTNRKYSYVQVTFNLYDSEGNQLGTAIDNINNLEANGRWKFKAIALSEAGNIASYKLEKITGY